MPFLRTILALALLALATSAQADTVRIALVSLCDPAKIATLTSDRAANPRVRKIAYWLEVARQQGRVLDLMLVDYQAHPAVGDVIASLYACDRCQASRPNLSNLSPSSFDLDA